MDPGTDPADTPDSFRLRSLTTALSSDQDLRGTVLSGIGCCSSPSLQVSMFSRYCRPFREVIRTTGASTTSARLSCSART